MKIYSSVKEEDSLKIGRFGLGFKSVFHMTDTPIIISDDRVLIISPLEDIPWKVCHTIRLKKVYTKGKYRKLKDLLNQVLGSENDILGIEEKFLRKGNYKGTLFWFPLRLRVPKDDPISSTIYTQKKVEDLFHSFHREASMVLLFLKHVDHISLHTVEMNEERCKLFSVEIKGCNNESISNERRKVSDHLKSCQKNHIVQKSINSIFQARINLVEESRSEETRYLISTVYQGSEDMSPEMKSLLNNDQLKYQPYVGVALPFDRGGFSPHVFCFLPLPLEKEGQSLTNLPFHVNGSFALDSNRRHMNWPTNDRTEDKDVSLKWNRLMITEVLPTAFVNLMTYMVERDGHKDLIYKALPHPGFVDKKWAILLPNLFKRLFTESIFLTESQQAISFKEAVFSIIDTTKDNFKVHFETRVFDIVKRYCPNFVNIPSDIQDIILSEFKPCAPSIITPKYIHKLLSNDKEGRYKRFSRREKLTLLVFLTIEDDLAYLESFELMPVNSKRVGFKCFKSTDKPSFFLASKEQERVLYGLEDMLLTTSDLEFPEAISIIKTLSQKGLYGVTNITNKGIFQNLLKRSLEISTKKCVGNENRFVLRKKVVTVKWLERLWEYLAENVLDIDSVENLQIFPIFHEDGHILGMQRLTEHYIEKSEYETKLPERIQHVLQTLGIFVLHHIPQCIKKCRQYRDYVHSPNSDGIRHVLQQCLSSSSQVEMANKMNNQCSQEDLLETAIFLTENKLHKPEDFSMFLKHACLFKATESEHGKEHSLCSVNECDKMLPSLQHALPIHLPRKFLAFSQETLQLAESLGVKRLEEMELIEDILREIISTEKYSPQDVQKFMNFFLKYYVFDRSRSSKASVPSLDLASKVRFLYDQQGVPQVANHFFDPTVEDLKILFLSEKAKFANYLETRRDMVENVRKIGLKSAKDVCWEDLLDVAKHVSIMTNPFETQKKSEMLVKFLHRLEDKSIIMMKEELRNIKWVPFKSQRPRGYSPLLSWYGDTKEDEETSVVCTPCEVVDEEYEDIIGSTKYVCIPSISLALRQFSYFIEPNILDVINHWKHVINTLDANETTSAIIQRITNYLIQISENSVVADEVRELKCISIDNAYVEPRQIYMYSNTKENEKVSLKPYRYHLPTTYRNGKFEEFFTDLGCKKYLEAEDLVSVLHEIRESFNDTGVYSFSLVEDLLSQILECRPNPDILSKLILPTNGSDALNELSPIALCVHVEDPFLFDVMFPEEIKVVDRRLSGEIVSALGIKDVLHMLIERGYISKTQIPKDNFNNPYRGKLQACREEHFEISCIYLIIKELERRGCTSIKFVIDERRNQDIQNGQFCRRLAESQGPALWILHNARSDDPEDVVSLLGTISDLPSIFTKHSLTTYDMNGNIFEETKYPSQRGFGIKISLHDETNAWLLKGFPNAFILYQNMCGKKFMDDLEQLSEFETTLFRLPLRRGHVYGDQQTCRFSLENIHRLFQNINRTIGDLLIFAENIVDLEVSFIPENISSPRDIGLKYRARSDILQTTEYINSFVIEKSISVQHLKDNETIIPSEHSATWFITKMQKRIGDSEDTNTSVAVPKDDLFRHEKTQNTIEGFSAYAKLFNIFPLIDKTSLPVHINGTFSQSDVISLGKDPEAVEFNKFLLQTGIANSYILLMEHLSCNSGKSNYLQWPTEDENEFFNSLVHAFYEQFLSGNLKLFVNHEAFEIQQCIFLDFELRQIEDIGDIAQRCFEDLHEDGGKANIDLPFIICKQLEKFMLTDRLPIVKSEFFWKKDFLPSLSTDYWLGRITERNKLIVLAVHRCKEWNLASLLKTTRCIPTTPRGELARPCDLVHLKPESVLHGLFAGEEGRFVQDIDEFKTSQIRGKLFELGMMQDFLRTDVLEEITRSIEILSTIDPTKSVSRYSSLLAYLKSLTTDEYENAISVITPIPWIPIVPSVSPYPSSVKWHGNGKTHCNIKNGYLFEHRYLVGAISNIYIDDRNLDSLLSNRKPPEKKVIENLLRVIESFREGTYSQGYDVLVNEAYSFLSNRIQGGEISQESLQQLRSQKCVWSRQKFVLPSNVCLKFDFGMREESLEPFMYCFDSRSINVKFIPFLYKIGCHECLTIEMLLKILGTLNDEVQRDDQCLLYARSYPDLDKCLGVALAIIETVTKIEISDDQKARMMLPVKDQNKWRMCPIADCVYVSDDILMDSLDDNLNILVDKIDIKTARNLGVPSLNQRLLRDNDELEFEECGQSEPLTTRIKGLLDDYSDGFAIPKELVQNADDAGARKIGFMYDERSNHEYRTGLIDEGMEQCQGSALWVFNDKLFSEKDFRNITKLAGKTKESERSKIGKFGLGFCSVYNLTDVPSFVSGNSIVIFDPHTFHLNKALKNKSNPGIRIRFQDHNKGLLRTMQNQFMPFNGIFGCDFSGADDKSFYFNGTLFRLPLRTVYQAEKGSISNNAYSKKDMIELLKKFASSVGCLMVFTQNIESIEVFRLKDGAKLGQPDLLFEACRRQIGGTGRLDMLDKIAEEYLNNDFSNKKASSVEVEINIRTTQEANDFLGIENKTSSYRWIISTSTGGNETLQMARELEEKGAVPIGCVAISDVHVRSRCLNINKEPFGFEGNNRLFCFLPLPICNLTLSVFVNGCFFVEKNRKSLHLSSSDDEGSHDKKLIWNNTLLGDAICDAYINVISELPIGYHVLENKCSTLYEIWPKFSETPERFRLLTKNFYTAITSFAADKPIFILHNQKMGMNDCIFLDFSLRYEDPIGKDAHDFLLCLATPKLKTVTDMPQVIYKQFIEAECADEIPILTTVEFFSTYFFKNIHSNFWKDKENSRNALVLYALTHFSKNDDLLSLISITDCIPTRPHGLLRRPSELISEVHCGVLKDLFSDADERFIESSVSQQFSDSKIMGVLLKLGLKSDTLPEELLCERAESVIKQGTPEKQLSRCEALLHYIQKHADSDLPYRDLKSIKFLPVQEKPEKWPIKWHSAQEINTEEQRNRQIQFECPENIASHDLKCIVGSVLPILQKHLEVKFSKNYNDSNVFCHLGVKTKDKLSIDDAIGQLRHISETSSNSVEERIMKEICEETYSFIGEYIMENQDVDLSEFKARKIIHAGNKLVKPKECIMELPVDCHPEFYCMKKVWGTTSFSLLQFFRSAGVRRLENKEDEKCLNINDLLDVLKKFEVNIGNSVEENDVILIINLLTSVEYLVKKDRIDLSNEVIERLFAPDVNNIIRKPTDICIDDKYDKLSDELNLHIVHDKMTRGLLSLLKIKTKRAQYISQFDFVVSFGQEEKLTTRIRGILEDHPSEISVFNELLQNADDASATEIIFILDKRMHGTEHIFDDTMKETQGPALCVYNDSSFTEDDIVGISRLGEGSKRFDSSKTGQFGIGFNAVYNVTDVPSILTKGPGTPYGGTLIVFDPHRRYFPGSSQPGIRVPNLEIIEKKYPDVFAAHLQNDQTFKREAGTWFRFPLRDSKMAASSDIKPKTITTDRIEELMSTFVGNAEKSLLFMTTLRNISLFVIGEDGSCVPVLTMSSSLQPDCLLRLKGFKENVKKHMSHIKSDGQSYTEREVITYDLDITENNCIQNRWRIVQNFNAYSGIPDVLIDAIQKDIIRLSPRGGVAFRLKPTQSSLKQAMYKRTKENKPGEHSAFSFLPLSMESTGLPLHVNGHFVLHSSRTSIWEDEDVNRTTLQGQWNHFLLSSVIPCSYVELMKSQVKDIMDSSGETREPLKTYYNMFPEQAKCSNNTWKILVTGMYQMLIDLQIPAMPILSYPLRGTTSIRWVCLYKELANPIYFDNILQEYESRDSKKTNDKVNVSFPLHTWSYHDEEKRRIKALEERRAKALSLGKVFKEIGMKLVDAPLWIRESIVDSKCCVGEKIFYPECIAPITAINFLKSWSSNLKDKCSLDCVDVKVDETIIETVDRAKQMLEYCFHEGDNAGDMYDTPLLVDESNELKLFSIENKLFVTQFSHLLPASRHLFLHKDLVICLNTYREGSCLKELTLKDFAELIHLSLDMTICTESPRTLTTSESDILNESWISDFWDFLQSRAQEENIDRCKQILEKWTFLPSKRANSDRTILYSFEDGHAVLDAESFRRTADDVVGDALVQLRLPKPHSFKKDRNINLMRKFIATSNKPVEVLKCLYYHRSSFDQIENVSRLKILQYFNLKMKSLRSNGGVMEMLREIPLHATINNMLTRLSSFHFIILLTGIDNQMPLDGLSKLMDITNAVFLQDNPSLHDLYSSFLGTRKYNEFQFYIEYVIPNLHSLELNERVAQLTFIRKNLMRDKYNPNEKKSLQTTLQRSRFISCPGNNLVQMALNFYSPHVPLFSKLCDPNELPPPPFHGKEWEQLMILAGMITNAPYQRILEFAQYLETKKEVSGEVEKLSKLVVQHVRIDLADSKCRSFLNKLCSIRFLCPHRVPDYLQNIYPQYNRKLLIAYRNSVLSEGETFGWTTCELLPEYANRISHLSIHDTMPENLGYSIKPSLSDCVSHIHNICHRQQQECFLAYEANTKRETCVIESLMDTIYEFLLQYRTNITGLRRMISESPFIYVSKYDIFLTADQVVLDIEHAREILPYLCKGPERFGKYFDLFRDLGCKDNANAFHFSNVLKFIYNRVGQERCPLMHKELDQVHRALLECFKVLKDGDGSLANLETFYLPSEQDILIKSTNLVFNNRPLYKKRLQNHDAIELSCVKHLGIDGLKKKLMQLPRRIRPILLSDLCSEHLHSFTECNAGSNLMKLQNVFYSLYFIEAILVIANSHNLTIEEKEDIRSSLVSLRIQPVSSLATILHFRNEKIMSSVEEQDLFWTKRSRPIVIYMKNSTERYWKWIDSILTRLVNFLKWCTNNKKIPRDLLKDICHVEDPTEIRSLVAELDASRPDDNPVSWLPDLGSSVPIHFHDLLNNSLRGQSVRFEQGEIAVYEMYDTSIDGNDPNGDAEFIYVKIIRILENDSTDEFFQMYEIYDGRSNANVYSFRLYKMIRHPDPSRKELVVFTDGHEDFTHANRDGIFNEIRKTLARAWRGDRNDFKRIMKRMLLRWHPDKNLSEKEFCTEVTQFILDIVRRLENGEDVFNEEENCSYNRWRERYRHRDFSNWSYGQSSGSAYAFGAGVGSSAKRRRQRFYAYSGPYTYSNASDTHNIPPNPQPESAKRWLQQAKCDLDSANREIERERQGNQRDQYDDSQRPIFNWICYKAHQAAEKALKARVLNIDANKLRGRSFTSHDLLNLAAAFGHDELRQLASEFRDQVVSEHTAMRYPQNFTQGKIPTDVFVEKDAEKAIELAEKIIDIVDSQM
ncbi:hypothetical protein FSP39_019049 [Pinctada imbricata]|uniref:HEPN domain-containing protein n=1 Tax=Pinctada imbricata TaxID=66713 RepID=A0AA89C620_PINIB|nr:hypothetical protein FSP39_019049 [Pinctada imbricata]